MIKHKLELSTEAARMFVQYVACDIPSNFDREETFWELYRAARELEPRVFPDTIIPFRADHGEKKED